MSDLQFTLDFSARLSPEAQIGMQQADDNANEKWKHWFDGCVLSAAKKKPEITSDDVLAELEALPHGPSTHNLAAIGPAMIRAAKAGYIRGTNRTVRSSWTDRPKKHGNIHRVWESLVYQKI